jgi:hypothetical protein
MDGFRQSTEMNSLYPGVCNAHFPIRLAVVGWIDVRLNSVVSVGTHVFLLQKENHL